MDISVILDDESFDLKLVPKSESKLMKVIDWIPFIPKSFMTSYWTTLGQTLFVPSRAAGDDMGSTEWKQRYVITLRHEARHARNWKRYGWYGFCLRYLGPSVMLGLPLCLVALVLGFVWSWWPLVGAGALTLLLLPLSVGLAYWRWVEERDAFLESVLVWGEERAEQVAEMLWTDYAWTWPRSWTVTWYIRRLEQHHGAP